MIDDYCPEKHAGTPGHTCLCYHQPNHHGGHECRCGHYWGIDWNTMTYDQEWDFLGLPDVRSYVASYRMNKFGKDVTSALKPVADEWNRLTKSIADAFRDVYGTDPDDPTAYGLAGEK